MAESNENVEKETETETTETETTEINESEIEKQALKEQLSDLKKTLDVMKKELIEVKKLNYKLLNESNVEEQIDLSQFSTR